MSIPTAVPATANGDRAGVAHPDWCSPEHCDATAGHADIRHSAAPLVWTTAGDDVEVQLAVQRDDELVDGVQHIHGHGLTLRLQHLAIENPDGSPMCMEVKFTEQDLDQVEEMIGVFRDVTARV